MRNSSQLFFCFSVRTFCFLFFKCFCLCVLFLVLCLGAVFRKFFLLHLRYAYFWSVGAVGLGKENKFYSEKPNSFERVDST